MTNQNPSPSLYTSLSNTAVPTNRNRQNLVLSTSFVSARKLDDQTSSPSSPQKPRRHRSSTTKSINSLKHDIHSVQQDLSRLHKSKEDAERRKLSVSNDFYPGNYSKEHLRRHSVVLQTNKQIREADKQIKKSSELLGTLKQKLESSNSSKKEDCNSSAFDHSSSVKTSEETASSKSLMHEDHVSSSISDVDEDASEDLTDHENSYAEEMTGSGKVDEDASNEHATWLVSDYLQSLQDKSSSNDFILDKANALVSLLQRNPAIKQDLVFSAFSNTIQQLLLNDDEVIVSAGYRICRHLITGPEFIEHLMKLRLEPFLIISLAKDNSYNIEREQALKLIRSFLENDAGITVGILQAIISCIEKSDDKLRNIALETLLETCYINPRVVQQCRGIRVLESVISENSPSPLTLTVLDVVLDLMAFYDTRQFFEDGFRITVLLTTLAETQTKSTFNAEKLQNSAMLFCKCLKNYNGLILFSADNFKPLKELLTFFQVPSLSRYLIDVFLDLLRIKPLPYGEGKKTAQVFKTLPSQYESELMPVNQYVGLLVRILDDVGFMDYLLPILNDNISTGKNHVIAAKLRYLISEYCNICMNLTGYKPELPGPFDSVIPNKTEKMLSESCQFEKMTTKLNKHRNTLGMTIFDSPHNITEFSEKMRHNTLLHDVDEVRFKKMVYDSKVLQTKDYSVWNWNILSELIEGPLVNPKRIEVLARTTKFFRRLLVFYRPMRYRFSKVKQGTRLATRYIQVGCEFFKTLTATAEGLKILLDDTKLIPQIASLLYKEMETQESNNVFSEASLKKTVCYGYFKILGVLSQSTNGVRVLERWNIFTVIYKMFQQKSSIAQKFLLYMLPELDMKQSPHCRNILSMALVHQDESIRMFATELLGSKLMEQSTDSGKRKLERVFLELLIRQLYDLSPEVIGAADKVLYDYCVSIDWSRNLVLSPRHLLNQLVFIRSPLLFEFLQTSSGFRQLDEIDFVQTERQKWLSHKNREYVFKVEDFINSQMHNIPETASVSRSKKNLPMHFYHSLASTEDGIALISQSGDFISFMNVVKRHRHEASNYLSYEDCVELKAALWCCGFIGSTELGVGLLDNYSTVNDIVCISYSTPATCVKFTTFYVLGLISRTKEGCEILDELGWDCCLSVQNEPMGLTFPTDIQKLLCYSEKPVNRVEKPDTDLIDINAEDCDVYTPPVLKLDNLLSAQANMENTMRDSQEEMKTEMERQVLSVEVTESMNDHMLSDEICERALHAVRKLCNHILSNAAVKEINDLQTTYGPARFQTPEMFAEILELLDEHRFKPQVRKYICELFLNKKTLEMMIRRDRKRRK